MICSRCKKRMAVVFMSKNDADNSVNDGYCFTCAKALGIKPINDLISQIGITEEEIDSMSEQIVELGPDGFEEVMGGSATFPFMNMFSGSKMQNNNDPKNMVNNDGNNTNTFVKEPKDKKRKYLNSYCENLTEKAKKMLIDNIIGRNNEIQRVIQILSRRTKNNPCLIGEPGVGKTAIAEGIAQRIVNNQVPPRLLDKEIYLLDLTALVAGTQFRGQFEGRIKGLVEEVKREGNIILFIDEVHNLVGAGDSEGSMNAANILKPALSRGEIQVIGATTFKEYRKYIEKDSALERRFQPIQVNEPTIEQTIEVVVGIKHYYENYHKVKIPNDIIVETVNMAEKYITDRFLPDKAIDLLDEACSLLSLTRKEISDYDTLIKQLTVLEKKRADIENAKEIDYEILAQSNTEILAKKEELKKLEPIVSSIKLTYDDLAKVTEVWTGIPAEKIKESDVSKIRNLKDELSKRVIGQEKAIDKIVNTIKRNRLQLNDIKRPASFIFLGNTGVGKTELAKALAEELFDSSEALIRFDMSEFMEKHSSSKLIGSPPGYVGYDDDGQLTEKVRRHPYSLILFDEIEKAHPEIMNILLQILDEGKLTDSHGRRINFENTTIIMTSNAGFNFGNDALGFNKSGNEISETKAMKGLKDFVRPEFLSRVDEVIVFNILTDEDYFKICDMMIKKLADVLMKNRVISLSFTESVVSFIAKIAKNDKYGARDIRRHIRREIEDKIANIILENFENQPKEIKLNIKDDKLSVDCL